ncbi:MAG TPA: hypothetical protein VK752_08040 [Bryobacteraceae bacterium]|jgi:hypothetical protein|nr:hypothetical protein [Bryobacteraceae bacterium]
MPIQKLTPDRDLQCYYFEPSAIAALSSTSATGFAVSGTWRQQFDWAVIEWNRDNVYEHPAFRNLPDGDLSGLVLSYLETRTNCIPLDSDLYATVAWNSLRLWDAVDNTIYYVPIASLATPVAGSYQNAYADFTLSGSGTPAAGTHVGIAYLETHYTYEFTGTSEIADALTAIAFLINLRPNPFQPTVLQATVSGSTIRVSYTAGMDTDSTSGANGNLFGMYTYSETPAATWDSPAKTFANGTSPTQWSVSIDFSALQGYLTPDFSGTLISVPTNQIRKMRWTYSAALQVGTFARNEFEVVVSDWSVTGTSAVYSVAGPGSRRVEDDSVEMIYSGAWTESRGNFSGGIIHSSTTAGDFVSWSYTASEAHTLYLGTRYLGLPAAEGASISIVADGGAVTTVNLLLSGEDVLIRWPIGEFAAGSHSVTVSNAGPTGNYFYFDFFEIAVPTQNLPTFPAQPKLTLATDWDTLHSISLAPERTAWFIDSLGFTGRQNHYVGALWFYELVPTGFTFATSTVTFSGTITVADGDASQSMQVTVESTVFTKTMHPGDTADTLAIAFEQAINDGSTGIWASASGGVLTITSMFIGAAGNSYTLSAVATNMPDLTVTTSGSSFAGGTDGNWRTDLAASPRLNRAVRDWSLSYFTALHGYGIDAAASFSMELGNGDPSSSIGIAQQGPAGDPIRLPTPSLQTNFSPTSLAYWQEVYAEMAGIQAAAGLTPFLQFGEVQWWYFPNNGFLPTDPAYVAFSGMPFYDAWSQAQFLAEYGRAMTVFTTNTVDPASYPDEVAFLQAVLGNFTAAIMTYVRTTQPSCRFEVLYPTDVNATAFNSAFNFPPLAWTPTTLTILKTECFGYTLGRDLNQAGNSIDFGASLGFTASHRSHLVGVGDSTTAWLKEVQMAEGRGLESVVLFALDQYCLIGYATPLPPSFRRSIRMGN